ncbi:MAG: glycerophosphoryl diester phosphodiesterase membrane domain-containing protein [Acidothermus sp.]|nr:glycerophosphoryl diester phosphodiesterase membrane domain-containing protein [Acidothermus sp.]
MVPLRPLLITEILDVGYAVIRAAPRVPFVASGIGAAVLTVVQIALTTLSGATINVATATPIAAAVSAQGSPLIAAIGGLVGEILAMIITGVVTGVVLHATFGAEPKRRRLRSLISASCAAALLPYTPPFLAVLITVAVGAGTHSDAAAVAIGVPVVGGAAAFAVFLWVGLSLSLPALVAEDTGVIRALRRSWELARTSFWRVLGVRVFALLLALLASLLFAATVVVLVGIPAAFADVLPHSATALAARILVACIGVLAWGLTTPWIGATLAVLYLDQRMRTEGLDIQLRLARLQERS